MRIAIYGGSFTPPHLGHALVAAWVVWTGRADQVWLVPVGGHAFGKAQAPFARRARWCSLLAETVSEHVRVETIEETLPKPSYTLNTLRALQERHPEHSFRLLLGADNLPDLPRWHRWEEIARDFEPLVVGRVGYASPPDVPAFPGISSTDVRARLVEGRAADALVPKAVLDDVGPDDLVWWAPAQADQ